jgi:deazaflavin-dependent oxidoreductase (nitroreductase family)
LADRLLRVRWIVRAPVWLYRARLGFVFGSRLLMLEHTGRKTGIRRYAVLETVGHPDPGTYIVAAGFGSRAQWLRNARRHPRAWAALRPVFETTLGARIGPESTSLPMIALDLAGSSQDSTP